MDDRMEILRALELKKAFEGRKALIDTRKESIKATYDTYNAVKMDINRLTDLLGILTNK